MMGLIFLVITLICGIFAGIMDAKKKNEEN